MPSMRATHATDANSPFVPPARAADNASTDSDIHEMEGIMQFTLHAGESAALAPVCTVRVRCHAGYLWITGFRNGEDVVLGAGESALLPPTQRHYFSALGQEPHAAFELGCEARDGMARWAVLRAWRLRWRETALRWLRFR
ncbi:DUF2917 domain-containing protein [Duganella sp. FT92W]|uniref:DUF2917 domain-containing protein n=1 Tax=Pseudoduganella rivuli TaxID=2666085 RepID=A0A7X2IJ73_9BURK|nr:DUF2917 domain-containing protein [Pseudoduganella rivuli]MRV70869.1 DUF2917 domain-containing protein [Pseudoduganella rivuli]